MSRTEIFKVPPRTESIRLDQYLSEKYPDRTRSFFTKLIKSNKILVNGQAVKSGYTVQTDDEVQIQYPEDANILIPADIPLNIIYEDDFIIVINKKAGMVVHPGRGTKDDTMVNALLNHCSQLSANDSGVRPGIVHRLDKYTSGLLVVAKTDQAHLHLRKQFDRHTIHRIYWALVWGKLDITKDTIETFINRSKKDPTKMAVTKIGRTAVTHIKTLQNFEYATLLEIKLDTGRTHQIRVHLNYIHHPVIGDPDYNGRESQLKGLPPNLRKRGTHLLKILQRQALHAKKLTFIHPHTEKQVEFESELPADFTEALAKLPGMFLLES
ncbi:MAG: RluA family pseudouridine synthase [Calditrichaceae bacterium]|jgi:23S rRNA pseudouridine1911/1915/1917 synthase